MRQASAPMTVPGRSAATAPVMVPGRSNSYARSHSQQHQGSLGSDGGGSPIIGSSPKRNWLASFFGSGGGSIRDTFRSGSSEPRSLSPNNSQPNWLLSSPSQSPSPQSSPAPYIFATATPLSQALAQMRNVTFQPPPHTHRANNTPNYYYTILYYTYIYIYNMGWRHTFSHTHTCTNTFSPPLVSHCWRLWGGGGMETGAKDTARGVQLQPKQLLLCQI